MLLNSRDCDGMIELWPNRLLYPEEEVCNYEKSTDNETAFDS